MSSEHGEGHIAHNAKPDAAGLLRQAGLRVTKPRLRILGILLTSSEPLDIEGIIRLARPERLDFSTVFRTVSHLETLGIVRRVHLGRSTTHYEAGGPAGHHDHITCNVCGRVAPLPDGCPLGEFEKLLAERTGFAQISHSLEFFGICPACSGRTTATPVQEDISPPACGGSSAGHPEPPSAS